MKIVFKNECSTLLFFCWIFILVQGHGRLIEPPSRSSMWRFGFDTEPNYNDNELFCGGFTVQYQSNGGKCGICGDNYQLPQPRPNEAGGKYGKGVITRKYNVGQNILATVELTANHQGFFEFKLCPNNNPKKIAVQECFDKYPLQLASGEGIKYPLPSNYSGFYDVLLRLPDGLNCSQCILQWKYTSGNNWGKCDDGTSRVGCGPQETFMGCSDVAISNEGKTSVIPKRPKKPITTWIMANSEPQKYTSTENSSTEGPKATVKPQKTKNKNKDVQRPVKMNKKQTVVTSKPLVGDVSKGKKCVSVGVYQNMSGMDVWCTNNCGAGFCPETHCRCV